MMLFIAFSWGVLLYENLFALNMITKGTLRDTLSKWKWRCILALMMRESYKVETDCASLLTHSLYIIVFVLKRYCVCI